MSNLRVGEYQKVETNKETCEKCGQSCPLLFRLNNEDTKREEQVCEGCWNQYYLEHPVEKGK